MQHGSQVKIVAIGDSITEAMVGGVPPERRWPLLLEGALGVLHPGTKFEVVNAGIGGQTSREGLARFDKDVIERRPDIVLIEFGGNDTTTEPERAVELPEFFANITEMVRRCRSIKASPLLLTFSPVIDIWHCWKDAVKYKDAGGLDLFVEAYRAATRKLAVELNAPFIDLDLAVRAAVRQHGAASQIFPDGVHLTEAGNRTAAAVVLAGVLAGILA